MDAKILKPQEGLLSSRASPSWKILLQQKIVYHLWQINWNFLYFD